jgi:hypothetical protein
MGCTKDGSEYEWANLEFSKAFIDPYIGVRTFSLYETLKGKDLCLICIAQIS